MTERTENTSKFSLALEDYFILPKEGFKQKFQDKLKDVGLPTKKMESYQYLPLRALNEKAFIKPLPKKVPLEKITPHILKECQNSYLVFINGLYQEDLSNNTALLNKVTIAPAKVAMKTFSSFINNHLNKVLKEEKDPLALLNALLNDEFLFLYVPPKQTSLPPIQILHFTTDDIEETAIITPRLISFIGAHAELNLVLTHIPGGNTPLFFNGVIELNIEENAHVKLTEDSTSLTDKSFFFEALRATLKKNSTLKSVMTTLGSATVRHDYHVSLIGEYAEAELNGLSMLAKQKQAHHHIFMEHVAPNCKSMQHMKNVNHDTISSFEGKIYVHKEAQKTEAFQMNNNLIFGNSIANSKPNLEIYADDVKASHGATVGQLDDDQLFYLRARGFLENEAKNLLTFGFCEEIIDKISILSLKEALSKKAKEHLA